MNDNAGHSLLPMRLLQHRLRTQLVRKVTQDLALLERQRNRVYLELCLDFFNPCQNSSLSDPDINSVMEQPGKRINGATLYWEQLLLSDGCVCSEVILMNWQRHTYLGLLDLLPATFGLFAPLEATAAMRFVNALLLQTLNNICVLAKQTGSRRILTTLYNPNLASLFIRYGFQQQDNGLAIDALPLPAKFIYTL